MSRSTNLATHRPPRPRLPRRARLGAYYLGTLANLAILGCGQQSQVGSDCEEADCTLSATAALKICHDTCSVINGACAREGSACEQACETDVDDGGPSVCPDQFETLHACCKPGDDIECERTGLDDCKLACPEEYVAYRACATSTGARQQASMPGERVGSCVDICGGIAAGCTSDGTEGIDECIEECVELRNDCGGGVPWLELSACCSGQDYEPVCAPEMKDIDIKRCRQACPEQWSACEAQEE